MAYNQFPYLQAHPPPGYGAPGQTGYFTTQNLGGFYAPISNQPFGPGPVQPQPQFLGAPGSSQMFTSWPGSAEEQEKLKKQQEEEQAKAKAEAKQREREERRQDRGKGRARSRGRERGYSAGSKSNRRMEPWDEVVDSLSKEPESYNNNHDGDNDGYEYDYDHCDNTASEGYSGSQTGGSSDERYNESGDNADENDDNRDRYREMVIKEGGSAHVVVHLERVGHPRISTTFIVSSRRMHAVARGWQHVCLQGTNDYDTVVTDNAGVMGMFWLLQVLHTGADGQDDSRVSNNNYGGPSNSNRLRPGMAPATTPRGPPPTTPPDLPARVLAYAAMFASQIGVLAAEDDQKPQMIGGGNGNGSTASLSPSVTEPSSDRFRSRAETWMRAVTNNPRCRRTLDSSVISPEDWLYVMFTARLLGDRQLFAVCLRTILDRWYLDERGIFCDANGPAATAEDLNQLPDLMRDTVLRDLTSFKVARERSVEGIITGALNAFY